MEDEMAKGQLRSNREKMKKKPKAEKNKSKTAQPASRFGLARFPEQPIKGSTGKNSP
jgi:hypothetical protein